MVSFKLEQNAGITNEEKKMLEEAKKLIPVYDEDSPELTAEMEKAFMEARKKKPYNAEPLTVYVSPMTIKKAKAIGSDYIDVLGRLLDKAVNEYVTMR
ncbi:MAG: hypothetical protein NC419_02575 [Muribaculaceae bacterium]|nr:hypothetical protein [Muribaculaceae bacterium]